MKEIQEKARKRKSRAKMEVEKRNFPIVSPQVTLSSLRRELSLKEKKKKKKKKKKGKKVDERFLVQLLFLVHFFRLEQRKA